MPYPRPVKLLLLPPRTVTRSITRYPRRGCMASTIFSFSGLKRQSSRMQAEVGKDTSSPHELPALRVCHDMAASLQRGGRVRIRDSAGFTSTGAPRLLIAGGVAANQELWCQLRTALPCSISYAPMACTDNVVMIATSATTTPAGPHSRPSLHTSSKSSSQACR